MKTRFNLVLFAILFFALSNLTMAQDKPYKEGTVWQLSFIKTKANMGDEYLKSLATTWKKVNEEAVKQGLILSYKVLSGGSSNPGDWDILLMAEFKNLASMEGSDEKWEAIFKSVVGGEQQQQTLNQKRMDIREIYGDKLMREIVFK